jgi:tripartite-type tricarboxylate transporter receptor subunit TctC
MSGTTMTHVPYKGNAPSIVDLVSGQVQFTFTGLSSVLPFVKNGKLKLLAVAAEKRLPSHPDMPTVVEAGFPGFTSGTWFSIVTRAGTPRPVIERLNREIIRVLQTPDIRERLEAQGYELVFGSPEALARLIAEDTRRYARVQKEIRLELD